MRPLIIVMAMIGFVGFGGIILAQVETPQPTIAFPTPGQSLEELATQVYENANRAADAADLAQRYADDVTTHASRAVDHASNLLGLIESFGAIISILIPIGAVLVSFLGIRRLENAQKELEDARVKFEKQIQEREAELKTVREDLEQRAKDQQERAAKANLALSLLPLGERQYKAQDYAGAIDTYTRALDLNPASVVTHYRLGYVYIQSGNIEEAQKHLQEALNMQPDFAPALAALGYAKRRAAEKMADSTEKDILFNNAESLLLKALAFSPKLIDEDGEAWWGSLGGLYRRRGQLQQAIAAYERASEATPHSSYAYGNLALLYAQTKNPDAMIRAYERVEQLAWGEVQGNIDNYWGYADLFTSRLAQGKTEKAEEALVSVIRTVPAENPDAFEMLADTLRRLQQSLGDSRGAHIHPFLERIEKLDHERKTKRTTQNTASVLQSE
jgi:tetratricopeptide (TPR) repeat protein